MISNIKIFQLFIYPISLLIWILTMAFYNLQYFLLLKMFINKVNSEINNIHHSLVYGILSFHMNLINQN